MKPEARLENWAVVFATGASIDGVASRLTGNVYEHDHRNNPLPDGAWVTTSPVICADYGAHIAETCNTIYRLGDPDPRWTDHARAYRPLADLVDSASRS